MAEDVVCIEARTRRKPTDKRRIVLALGSPFLVLDFSNLKKLAPVRTKNSASIFVRPSFDALAAD